MEENETLPINNITSIRVSKELLWIRSIPLMLIHDSLSVHHTTYWAKEEPSLLSFIHCCGKLHLNEPDSFDDNRSPELLYFPNHQKVFTLLLRTSFYQTIIQPYCPPQCHCDKSQERHNNGCPALLHSDPLCHLPDTQTHPQHLWSISGENNGKTLITD